MIESLSEQILSMVNRMKVSPDNITLRMTGQSIDLKLCRTPNSINHLIAGSPKETGVNQMHIPIYIVSGNVLVLNEKGAERYLNTGDLRADEEGISHRRITSGWTQDTWPPGWLVLEFSEGAQYYCITALGYGANYKPENFDDNRSWQKFSAQEDTDYSIGDNQEAALVKGAVIIDGHQLFAPQIIPGGTSFTGIGKHAFAVLTSHS